MKTNQASKPNPALKPFEIFIGEWEVEGTHPYFPDAALHGRYTFEPLEGGAFMVMRTHIEDARFPDGISIFGSDDVAGKLSMIYFDERGISRIQDVTLEKNALIWERTNPKFSQHFTLTISEDGNTMVGKGRMKKEGSEWEDDIQLTFKRA